MCLNSFMELLPGLPNDVALECLIRIPFDQFSVASSVCRGWKAQIELPEFRRHRKQSGLAQSVIVLARALVDPTRKTHLAKHLARLVYRIVLCDPETGYWSELPPVPGFPDGLPMFCHLVGVGLELVLMGGCDPVTWEVSKSVFIYNFVSGTWRRGADMPGGHRLFFGCASDSDRTVYVAGGHDDEKNALKSAMMYDVAKDEWIQLNDMAKERDECKAVFHRGKFHVISGYPTNAQGRFERDAEAFDLTTQQWDPVQEDFLEDAMCPRTCVGGSDARRLYMCRNGNMMVCKNATWQVLAGLPAEVCNAAYVTMLRAHEVCHIHKVEILDYGESLELFSWHAFGKNRPIDGFIEDSERVVQYCGGLPLAIKVLGSSLSGKSLNVWKSQLEKLKAIPDYEVVEKLKISYDSLPDEHDKNLFLHVACFFVGMDEDWVVTILDGCDFYTTVGIQNLIDRCLLAVDERKKLVMHQLVQEMGREIVRQESPKELGERSRLWNHKDSFNVLRENTGTGKIEGLKLDMNFLEDKYDRTVFGIKRKCHIEEFLSTTLLSNVGNSFKRLCFGIFSWQTVGTALRNSDKIALEVDAFARMHKLKLLQLKNLQVNGSFENFPKGLRWLCWHGFSFNFICDDFPLDNLVVLDMQYSNLQKVWEGTKFLKSLKILDLSHSHCLFETPDFLEVPNLERLILENCARLVEVHESVGHLQRLVLLNLKDCKNLRKLPRSIVMLKFLETLDISGCSNIKELPLDIGTMDSLTKLNANGIAASQLLSTTKEVGPWYSFIWPSLLKPRKSVEISCALLPRFLVHLSLVDCNLSGDAFPKDLSNLSSLQILNLSNNPICSLPNCIGGLTGLQILELDECERLQSLTVEKNLKVLSAVGCTLVEKVTFQSFPSTIELKHLYGAYTMWQNLKDLYYSKCGFNPGPFTLEYSSTWENQFVVKNYWRPLLVYGTWDNIIEIMGEFKLEPIGIIDVEIMNNLGLPNLGSMGSPTVMLSSLYSKNSMKLPLQGCHGRHIFYAYLPGSEIPTWFNLKNTGSSISFIVPSHFKIQALSVCSIYALSNNTKYPYISNAHTIINNKTKSLIWSHSPSVFGIPEGDEDLMWLSYWKFENQLEGGDELNISVVGNEDFQVKKFGVHLVYKEQEEKSSQSTSEEASQLQFSLYGNVVPGNASTVHPANKKVIRLGDHWLNCSICDGL